MLDDLLRHIAAWESAGLIDAATAERLRTAELAAEPSPPAGASTAMPAPRPSTHASFFGPSVSVVEAFSYLGGAFLLASWTVLIARLTNDVGSTTRDWILVAGMAIPAAVFFVIGLTLDARSPRLGRAAGVAFVLSVSLIWAGVTTNVGIFADGALPAVAGAAAGLVVALAYRWLHPSLLTQLAVLAALTGLVQGSLELLDQLIYPTTVSPLGGSFLNRGVASALIAAAAWIGCAFVIGLIGLAESRSDDPAAQRRAALARLWAGLVAVVGVAYALTRTEFDDAGPYRVIAPWVADITILVVSGVLLERAFRREAAAYVLASALGVVIALTDLNATYFAPTTGAEVALLVEGLLLIAIAFAAERVSRRVSGGPPPGAAEDVETAPA